MIKFTRYLNLIFSDILLAIFFVSGFILVTFISRTIQKEKHPVEFNIARIGGGIYMALAVVLFLLNLILN